MLPSTKTNRGFCMPSMPLQSRKFFRGTTEPWECAVMWGTATQHPRLGSGKQHVKHAPTGDIWTMTAEQINFEIIARVSVETASGTPNYFSHFVPCADSTAQDLSTRFGKVGCFAFNIYCVLYGPRLSDIKIFVAERNTLPKNAVPMFQGGPQEWLAYTGALITSVTYESEGRSTTNMNSLD